MAGDPLVTSFIFFFISLLVSWLCIVLLYFLYIYNPSSRGQTLLFPLRNHQNHNQYSKSDSTCSTNIISSCNQKSCCNNRFISHDYPKWCSSTCLLFLVHATYCKKIAARVVSAQPSPAVYCCFCDWWFYRHEAEQCDLYKGPCLNLE